jgi:hypothetical protein
VQGFAGNAVDYSKMKATVLVDYSKMNENVPNGHFERSERTVTHPEKEERMWPTFGAGHARMWCRHQYLKLLIAPTIMALLAYNQYKYASFAAKSSDYLSKLVELYECVVASERTLDYSSTVQCSSLNRSSELFYVPTLTSLTTSIKIRQFNCSKGAPDFYYDNDEFADLWNIENNVATFIIKNALPLLLTYLVLETLQLAYFDLLSIAPYIEKFASLPKLESLPGFRIGLCANDADGRGLHISYWFFGLGVYPTLFVVSIVLLTPFSPNPIHCLIFQPDLSIYTTTYIASGLAMLFGFVVPIEYYRRFLRDYLTKYKSFERVADDCRSHFIKRRFSEQATIFNRCPLHALLLVFLFLFVTIVQYLCIAIIVVLLCLRILSLIACIGCLILDMCFFFPLQLCPFNYFRTKLTHFRKSLHHFISTFFFSPARWLLVPEEVWIDSMIKCHKIVFNNGFITSEVKSSILESSE